MDLKTHRLFSMPKNQKINFTSNYDFHGGNQPNFEDDLILCSLDADVFEKQQEEEKNCFLENYDTFNYSSDDDFIIAAGPLGHPYTGRPIEPSPDIKISVTFLEWLLASKENRKSYVTPAIVEIFSLGDNNFDDEVAAYRAQTAKAARETAISLFQKGGQINIPIGDINNDGTIDKIVSGINRAIDITGDGKADIIGTLIDVDGDGKADFVLDQMGKMISLSGKTAKVMGENKITVDDITGISNLVFSLLGRNK